jgi:hypothetical protein
MFSGSVTNISNCREIFLAFSKLCESSWVLEEKIFCTLHTYLLFLAIVYIATGSLNSDGLFMILEELIRL